MLKMLLAAALVAGLAGAAQAETTRCEPIFFDPKDGVRCTTTRAPEPGGISWRDVRPTRCSAVERYSQGAAYCDARQVAANHKAVGDLIAAGKCDEALRGALGTGDLEFARQVREYCATGK